MTFNPDTHRPHLDKDSLAKAVYESTPESYPHRVPVLEETLEDGTQNVICKCGCEAIVLYNSTLAWMGCDVHCYNEQGELTHGAN